MFLLKSESITYRSGAVCLDSQKFWLNPEQTVIGPRLRGTD